MLVNKNCGMRHMEDSVGGDKGGYEKSIPKTQSLGNSHVDYHHGELDILIEVHVDGGGGRGHNKV